MSRSPYNARSSATSLAANFDKFFSANPNEFYSVFQDYAQNTSKALYYENTIGKMLVDGLVRHVVGKGLTPMVSPENAILGWTPERIQKFTKQTEAYYRIVAGSSEFDYYGKHNFAQLQQIGLKSIFIDGDILNHPGYKKLRNGDIFPYLQLISGKMIKSPDGIDSESCIGGVEINPRTSQETGYYIRVINSDLSDSFSCARYPKYHKGKKQFDLITIGNPDPAMVRGLPVLNAAKNDLLCIDKYKQTYLTKAIVQSILAVFIEKEKETDPNAPSISEKLFNQANGMGAEDNYAEADRNITLGAGVVVEGEPGEKFVSIQDSTASNSYEQFIKTGISHIASMLGSGYEVAVNSFNASFSASRASINGAEKNFEIIRNEFISKFCEPVYEHIVDFGIKAGFIDCPEYESMDWIQKKALFATTWVGCTPIQVDPTKEVNAYALAVDNGFCTHEVATRNLFGMDFDEVMDRLKEENKKIDNALSESLIPDNDDEEDGEEENE